MTIQTALSAVAQQLELLDGTLRNLEWAVLQAQPETDIGQGLAAQLGDRLHELMGTVYEARELAELGQQLASGQASFFGPAGATGPASSTGPAGATGNLGYLPGVRQVLIECHTRCNQTGVLFFNRLYAGDVAEALDWLEHDGQEDWITWVYGVKDALDRCLKVMAMGDTDNLNQALLQCWQELTDYPALVSAVSSGLSGGPVRQRAVDEMM